ncbi:MAG: hypothetical protein ACYTF0_06925, partial [Planctomycetota bacterium]|jgi:hypothetical protein
VVLLAGTIALAIIVPTALQRHRSDSAAAALSRGAAVLGTIPDPLPADADEDDYLTWTALAHQASGLGISDNRLATIVAAHANWAIDQQRWGLATALHRQLNDIAPELASSINDRLTAAPSYHQHTDHRRQKLATIVNRIAKHHISGLTRTALLEEIRHWSDPEIRADIIALLAAPQPATALFAIDLLNLYPDQDATKAIGTMLNHPMPLIADAARDALVKRDDQQALPAIIASLVDHSDTLAARRQSAQLPRHLFANMDHTLPSTPATLLRLGLHHDYVNVVSELADADQATLVQAARIAWWHLADRPAALALAERIDPQAAGGHWHALIPAHIALLNDDPAAALAIIDAKAAQLTAPQRRWLAPHHCLALTLSGAYDQAHSIAATIATEDDWGDLASVALAALTLVQYQDDAAHVHLASQVSSRIADLHRAITSALEHGAYDQAKRLSDLSSELAPLDPTTATLRFTIAHQRADHTTATAVVHHLERFHRHDPRSAHAKAEWALSHGNHSTCHTAINQAHERGCDPGCGTCLDLRHRLALASNDHDTLINNLLLWIEHQPERAPLETVCRVLSTAGKQQLFLPVFKPYLTSQRHSLPLRRHTLRRCLDHLLLAIPQLRNGWPGCRGEALAGKMLEQATARRRIDPADAATWLALAKRRSYLYPPLHAYTIDLTAALAGHQQLLPSSPPLGLHRWPALLSKAPYRDHLDLPITTSVVFRDWQPDAQTINQLVTVWQDAILDLPPDTRTIITSLAEWADFASRADIRDWLEQRLAAR